LIYVNALSTYLPSLKHDNNEIIADYLRFGGANSDDITADSVFKQTGVKYRYTAPLDETAKDLGNAAAKRMIQEFETDKRVIDYIIFVSDALEYKGPTTACIIQHNLGINSNSGAIDILHGCTGWIYGLSLAKALISSKQASNLLLITSDVPTKVIHPVDLELRALFSDGAAATLISNQQDNELNFTIGEFVFGTDGKGEKYLWVERSATKEPADIEWLKQYEDVPTKLGGGRLRMDSPKIFLFALRNVPKLIQQILAKNQLGEEDIDFYVLHQANGTMLEFLRKRMKIPKEKFIISIENVGNTVSSSIPFAMKEMMDKGKIKAGHKVLVAGFGIGLSWGGTVLQF